MTGATLALNGSGTTLAGNADFLAAVTVLRMLGSYTIGLTAAPAALDDAVITLGIGVVSSDAAALGSTAMPDPNVELEFPWLYWADHAFFYRGDAADHDGTTKEIRKSFDVRSMRKIKPRESLAMIVEYNDLVGTPPMRLICGAVRVLLAVH